MVTGEKKKGPLTREGRRLLGGTGAATVAPDWGESLALLVKLSFDVYECTP
jgi:hypothetical protein